jgi:hypothetical protein
MSIPKTAKSARLITSAGETKQIEFKDDKICLDGKMHIYDFGVILFSQIITFEINIIGEYICINLTKRNFYLPEKSMPSYIHGLGMLR